MKKLESKLFVTLLCVLLLALVLMMQGCVTSMKPSVAYRPPAPPADLAAPCPDLPLIADGQAVTVAAWIVDTAETYRDCQERQSGLVRAWPGQSFSGALGR